MNLSRKDRVLLINQYEILKALDTENSSYYEELIEILQNGYEIFYSEMGELMGDDMPWDEGKFVLEILDFYRIVEDYKRSNPGDEEIEGHDWSHFKGFDGNNETGYINFARFLIERQGKFAEQLAYKDKTDNYNSHRQTLDKYKSMVQKWHEMDRSYKISKDNIMEILNVIE